MYCAECGNEIKEGEEFCRYCGRRVTPATQGLGTNSSETAYRSQKSMRKGVNVPILVAATVVTVLVTALVSVFTVNKVKTRNNSKYEDDYDDITSNSDSDNDHDKDNVSKLKSSKESIVVTKELEDDYVNRIKAYEEYYEKLKNDYSEYKIGATVTLDGNGLPLFWVIICKSYNWDDVLTTQLVGYLDGEAKVLAEKSGCLLATRGPLAMAKSHDDDIWYLYDEETNDFKNVSDTFEAITDGDAANYSYDDIEEEADMLSKMMECMNYYDAVDIMYNDDSNKIAYIGTAAPQYYIQALGMLGVFGVYVHHANPTTYVDMDSYYTSNTADDMQVVVLNDIYSDNNTFVSYFKSLESLRIDDSLSNELISTAKEDGVTPYNNEIKEMPKDQYTLYDGSTIPYSEATKYLSLMRDAGWENMGSEAGEYLDELNVDRILRELQEKPLYTDGELYLYIVSVVYGYDITDVDLNDYIISKASDDYIANVVRNYVRLNGDSYKPLFTDELIDGLDKLENTEPYETIDEEGIDKAEYEDGIATIYCDNDVEYEFQVEFNDAGDKISAITYIDPYADLSSWKVAYINALHDDDIMMLNEDCNYSLIDINGNGIPELFYSDYYEEVNGYYTYMYTYDNGVVSELLFGTHLEIYNNIIYNRGRHEIYAYRLETDNTLTELFLAEEDATGYYFPYNGINYLEYEAVDALQATIGIDLDLFDELVWEYKYDDIESAIIQY